MKKLMHCCITPEPEPMDIDLHEPLPPRPIKKRKATIPKSMRVAVWNTYIGETIGRAKCLVCGHMDITQMNFHCGHVIAEVNGGKVSIENLRPICASCNLSMRTTNMHEFAQKYFR
jgi:5-methylcytosine-specific restriction endonuclease McrA